MKHLPFTDDKFGFRIIGGFKYDHRGLLVKIRTHSLVQNSLNSIRLLPIWTKPSPALQGNLMMAWGDKQLLTISTRYWYMWNILPEWCDTMVKMRDRTLQLEGSRVWSKLKWNVIQDWGMFEISTSECFSQRYS